MPTQVLLLPWASRRFLTLRGVLQFPLPTAWARPSLRQRPRQQSERFSDCAFDGNVRPATASPPPPDNRTAGSTMRHKSLPPQGNRDGHRTCPPSELPSGQPLGTE